LRLGALPSGMGNPFGYLFFYLSFLAVYLTPVVALVWLPLYWWARRPGRAAVRGASALLIGYLALAAALGAFAYQFVPAQYTRYQRWQWPPTSSSLGEIHAVFLERLDKSGAIAPERAPEIRQMVDEERAVYSRGWTRITLTGLAMLLAALFVYGGLAFALANLGRRASATQL
jgi:hypothetical protein